MNKFSPEDPSKVVIVHHPPQPEEPKPAQTQSAAPRKNSTKRPAKLAVPQPEKKKVDKKPKADAKDIIKEKTVR